MGDEGQTFILGMVFAFLLTIIFFQVLESDCQREWNVADCEWSKSPFLPTEYNEND